MLYYPGMFGFFKKKTKYHDVTSYVSSISELLVDDSKANFKTPYKQYLDTQALDFSLESLKIVDKYLEKIRNRFKKLNNNDQWIIVLRCGAYCGEVMRRQSKYPFIWIDFSSLQKVSPEIAKILGPADINCYLLEQIDSDHIYTPIGKAVKFIRNGMEDSLFYFAYVFAFSDNTQKK